MVGSTYMVYIPVYSVYAIYTGVHVSIVMYIVYIPVYSVYAIYRRDKSVCWTVCIWCIYLYIVYMPYTQGYMSVSSCIWCIYLYILYMPYTGETSQFGGQCVYGVYTCI